MRDDWSEQFENWKKTKVAKTERKPEPKFTQRELSLEPKAPCRTSKHITKPSITLAS
jgi:hypothetical protein